MVSPIEITPTVLRDLISYDPETGDMVWKKRSPKYFTGAVRPVEWQARQWNSKFAGKPALAHVTNTDCLSGSVLAKQLLAHRVAWAIHYGAWPKADIDHINGNRSDNRIANLRDVNTETNNRNARRRKDNSSGYAGVYKDKNRYLAHLRIDGRQKVIGRFDCPKEAYEFRQKEMLKYGYHPNHGRD